MNSSTCSTLINIFTVNPLLLACKIFRKSFLVINISCHNPVIKCLSIGFYCPDISWTQTINRFTVIDVLFVPHTLWTQEVGPPSLWFWPSTRKQWFPLEIWHVQWSSSTRAVCVASLLQNSAGWTRALGMMPEMTKRLYTLIREAFNNAIVVTN